MIFFCRQMLSPKHSFKSLPFLFFKRKFLSLFFSHRKNLLTGATDFKVIEINPPALDLLVPPARTHQRTPKVSSDASLDSLL